MIISLIVAASTNNAIGKDNQLLWRLPNDTKFFKNTTWGMPVIMGRKTYDAFNGEPLPGRFNFVITHNPQWRPGHDKVKVTSSLSEALQLARETDSKEIFVIGGGQIYAEAMDIADKIYMTRVHAVLEGDAYFPPIDEKVWQLTDDRDFPADDKHAYAYSFQVWLRKK
ncbi:dihydrofolate reductase [Puia dinghuensis]|uniref:Dihydrofolate reductase n=1 Tax=Puia dinghuensis TaxID=1792502 RepID=A0A8J2UIC6_9BACT|nr:dihydrofolate reductase [Puia dinghuensis]GGB21786.1 dihydrofolate reductase [Puia dinghuensis]